MQVNRRTGTRANRSAALFASTFLLAAAVQPAEAWTYKTLYSFTGGSDGSYPIGGLKQDEATGILYGATIYGGDQNCDQGSGSGCGTLFDLAPDGTETILHVFTGDEGARPYAGPIRDRTGNLYGTTRQGGGSCNGGRGCGVIYKLMADQSYSVLHRFQGGDSDGAFPVAGLTRNDTTGDLYGTTPYGGDTKCDVNHSGCGVVFKLAANGDFTILHAFHGGDDGSGPATELTLDSSGNIYGTTSDRVGCEGDCGTVFKISADGTKTTLHVFKKHGKGYPSGKLVLDKAGNLYGPCGGQVKHGAIFEIDSAGKYRLLYTLGRKHDYQQGIDPIGKLVRDNKSATIYGAERGADPYTGGVFQLQDDGTYQLIYSFSETGGGGWFPAGGLISDAHGNLFGLTSAGGAGGQGAVYELKKKG